METNRIISKYHIIGMFLTILLTAVIYWYKQISYHRYVFDYFVDCHILVHS